MKEESKHARQSCGVEKERDEEEKKSLQVKAKLNSYEKKNMK